MTAEGLFLLLALFLAHYLGDFTPLATSRMQEAKTNGGPITPIAAHAAVHGSLVGVAVATAATPAWPLILAAAGIEFGTHLTIDATRGRLSRSVTALRDPGQNLFWYALGIDQLAHSVVLLAVAALVL